MRQPPKTNRPALLAGAWTAIISLLLTTFVTLSSSPSAAQPNAAASPRPDGLTTYPMPMQMADFTSAPDGNFWAISRHDDYWNYTPPYRDYLHRITPLGSVLTYTLPYSYTLDPDTGLPDLPGRTIGPDGNLWLAWTNELIRFEIATGTTTTFSLPATAYDIASGPDRNLWLTSGGAILRCTLAGVCTSFSTGNYFPIRSDYYSFGYATNSIISGPDGNLWFGECDRPLYPNLVTGAIGRITPGGVITHFPITSPHSSCQSAVHLTGGPDGNVWATVQALFTARGYGGVGIGRITPSGSFTLFPSPDGYPGWYNGITTGPDGNLWFTSDGGRWARLTTDGSMTWYLGGGNRDIITGPDGNLWMNGWYPNPALIKVSLTDGIPLPTGVPTSIVLPPTPTPPAGGMVWADVPSSDGYYPPITSLASRSIVGGYPCGGVNPQNGQREPCLAAPGAVPSGSPPYYRPGNWVSRGQAAKIIALSAGLSGRVGRQTFADVPASSAFFAPVEALAAAGLANGYRCGTSGEPCDDQNRPYFRPGTNITRGQLAKLIGGAANFGPVPPGQLFADVGPANGFYGSVQQVGSRGIIGGYPCGGPNEPCDSAHRPYYRPGDPATRAQTAKIDAGVFP